jgi:hypothetical protein
MKFRDHAQVEEKKTSKTFFTGRTPGYVIYTYRQVVYISGRI